MNLGSLLESEGEPILLLVSQLLLRSEGDRGMEEGRRGGDDNTVTTEGVEGGLAVLDCSRKISFPDVATGDKAEREDEGSGFDSGDGGLKLGRSAVKVDVETSDREFGSKVNVGVETTEVGGQEDLGGNGGKFCVGGVELALKLEASVENEDGLVYLDPLGTGCLEFGQELLVKREDLGEEGDRNKVGGGIFSGLAQPQVGDGTQDNGASRDTKGLGLLELLDWLIEVELEVGGLGKLGHNVVVVRVEPDGERDEIKPVVHRRYSGGTDHFFISQAGTSTSPD